MSVEEPFFEDIKKVVSENLKRPLKILDLGTGWGNFCSLWASLCKEQGGFTWTVDNYKYIPFGVAQKKIVEQGLDGFVEFIQGNDLDEEIIKKICDKQYDIICIDTLHTYIQTLLELTLYEEFLVPDGIFILHDTAKQITFISCEDRFKQVLGTEPFGARWGVIKFCKFFNFEILVDNEGYPGLMILKRKIENI